jgi:uncharacterized protein YhfF
MSHSPRVHEFWERAKKAMGITGTFQDAWGFGDSPQLKDELLELVLVGKKTGTTSLLKENEAEGWPEPYVGAYNVILDGAGKPRLVIETLSVEKCRFIDVSADHAQSEGEGDLSLEGWRREHRKYWARTGKQLGFTLSDDDLVIVERFRVIYRE